MRHTILSELSERVEIGGRGYVDWLEPIVDLRAMMSSEYDWMELWTAQIADDDAPRNWIRGMAEAGQLTMKVTPGTPGDNQIASYLTDVQHLVTADKNLVRLSRMLAESDPPTTLAESWLVPQGTETLGSLVELLERLGEKRQIARRGRR